MVANRHRHYQCQMKVLAKKKKKKKKKGLNFLHCKTFDVLYMIVKCDISYDVFIIDILTCR